MIRPSPRSLELAEHSPALRCSRRGDQKLPQVPKSPIGGLSCPLSPPPITQQPGAGRSGSTRQGVGSCWQGSPCLNRWGFPVARVSTVEGAAPASMNFGVSTVLHNSTLQLLKSDFCG